VFLFIWGRSRQLINKTIQLFNSINQS